MHPPTQATCIQEPGIMEPVVLYRIWGLVLYLAGIGLLSLGNHVLHNAHERRKHISWAAFSGRRYWNRADLRSGLGAVLLYVTGGGISLTGLILFFLNSQWREF